MPAIPTNLFNGMSTSTFLRLCTQAPRTSMRDGGKAPDDCFIPATVPVWRKNTWAGEPYPSWYCGMWYLIHIFDRSGGDVIVSTAVVSVRESEDDAVEYGEMDWERKESCTSYISMGRSLPGNRTGVCSPAWGGLRANAQNIRVRC